MKDLMALIYSSKYDQKAYQSLCDTRPDYMLPFGGRYRIIDFSLSNITNYNISKVLLYTDKNLRSTMDHIGDGKNWELNRRVGGLMINPPQLDRKGIASEIETYYESLKYFADAKQNYVYITNPMYITKSDISDAFEKIQKDDADALVFFKRVNDENGDRINQDIINFDENGNAINAGVNLGSSTIINLFAGSMILKKNVFINLLRFTMEKSTADNLLEALFKFRDIKITLYESNKHLELISDLTSYYKSNMNLLDKKIFNELFYEDGMVYTKSKDEPSTIYKTGSKVENSLVANGGIIEGEVYNSIIFRGVRIRKDAVIRNSILFQESDIGESSILNNCILDKNSQTTAHVNLAGNRANPYVTKKGELIKDYDYFEK
ncbi:MAG: glucose-1-phosphate adenylyltransferase subunit GlgD [Tissierellia bacterium]|nr:glucose-1-phosphate adenylyltransferase subunit GlgD [Tissierellia bacterium]